MDVAILVLLVLCALRGFWRGFFRESFGLLAVLVGIGASLQYAATAAAMLAERVQLGAPAPAGIAFIGIFMVVHTGIVCVGWLLDRVASTLLFRSVNCLAGALFAIAKGGVVLAFVLLFLHVFPVTPEVDQRIMKSELARPLVSVANAVLRVGWHDGARSGTAGQA